MEFKSSNPIFNGEGFSQGLNSFAATDAMTINGTINKTLIMTLLMAASASYTWTNPSNLLMMVGVIGGLVLALITAFRPKSAGITAPIYALLQGLALGGISVMFESSFGGIVFQAIASTIGVLFFMLFLYRSGIIKVTEKFKMGIVAATGGIFLMYMLNFILGFFGSNFLSLENTSLLMIGINLVVVAVAALNLVLDFDFIERGAQQGAPKYMEWVGAFGLMVTLVWLYLEMLKLLSRLQSRN